jgi:hypothetical protein
MTFGWRRRFLELHNPHPRELADRGSGRRAGSLQGGKYPQIRIPVRLQKAADAGPIPER